MHKLLNFFSFPLLLIGLIFISNGILSFSYYDYQNQINSNTRTSDQINKLYSEKEITLKDPPVSEKISDKIIVKIRKKPLNPNIILNIENKNNMVITSYLTDTDVDYLNTEKREFVKTVLPIIINENQSILITRNFLKHLKVKLNTFKTLESSEVTELNNIAKKFNVKYSKKHKLDIINELLLNVDIIPNSIVLAQAAIESGWGKSRFAKEYNALFGEYTYDQNKGVVPLKREDGDKHLIKSFNSYDSSVSSYFKNINSHYAYKDFRKLRNIMRAKNNFSDINLLISKLNSYAEDNNYIDTLNLVIQKNKFKKFDSKTIAY